MNLLKHRMGSDIRYWLPKRVGRPCRLRAEQSVSIAANRTGYGKARRHGLTLVELLAATILAALLMAAVLGVLKAVTRNQKVLLKSGTDVGWQTRFVQQLEWDLANSRTVVVTSDGFELRGYAGRNFTKGGPFHGSVSVQYMVAPVERTPCLFRAEEHLDSTDLDNRIQDLVAKDVSRIAIQGSEDSKNQSARPATSTPQDTDEQPIPDQPAVTLYRVGESDPFLSHVFNLR